MPRRSIDHFVQARGKRTSSHTTVTTVTPTSLEFCVFSPSKLWIRQCHNTCFHKCRMLQGYYGFGDQA